MATKIDQKAYLQKYLGGSSSDKKKKKKKIAKGKGFKIIDDDLDLSKLQPLDGDEVDVLGEGEDAPQIAGIIDERPDEVKKLEQFKTSSKWRVINQDDGFNSKLQIEEIKQNLKEKEIENELIFGKMYSDSEDDKKKESDISPPRKQHVANDKARKTGTNNHQTSDSDFSPPRRRERELPSRKQKSDKKYAADASPPRKSQNHKLDKNYDSDLSPPRKHEINKSKERTKKSRWEHNDASKSRQRSNFDASPPRKSRQDTLPRKSKNYYPQEKGRNSLDSDKSPPRKRIQSSGNITSKYREQLDSDASPPRKSRIEQRSNSPLRKSRKNRNPSDSDMSPPRKGNHSGERNKHKIDDKYDRNNHRNSNKSMVKVRKDRNYSDSDTSPPRKSKNKRPESPSLKIYTKYSAQRSTNKRKQDSDSDLSPPRKEKCRVTGKNSRRNSKTPPPSNKKMAKTLEGKRAGLQDAAQLRQENEALRRREDEVFNKMTDEVSGRNALVVSRKSKRENSEEKRKQREKAEKQKELDEKYKKWSKGIKQLEDQQARIQEYIHEAAKPLARHRGDEDLEDRLKQVEREGDPMLQYIRDKKRKKGELGPEKPTYKGNFPPNRFNIRPGYRWDGVDRSNGYEKKYFEQQSKRKAQEEEAYKWSTEDL